MFSKNIFKLFKNFQSTDTLSYHIFIRLPYIILIGWLGLTLTTSLLTSTDLEALENTGEPTIIRVVHPTCFSCVKETLFTFSSIKNIPVFQIDSRNKWAYKKRQEHNIQQRNFNILVTSDNHEIILPDDLSSYQLKQIIQQYY